VRLILLRHTRPDVAEGTCYGRTDVALAGSIETDAARVSAELPAFERIMSSPLGRCRRLAEHLGVLRGVPVIVDARLAEMDFGRWEGHPWAEIPRGELDAWAADFESARPHGGESPAMLAERVMQAAQGQGPGPALWVTHAGVVRAICARAAHHRGWHTHVEFGGWIEIDLAEDSDGPDT
jgi:alpha-ribazole phosphatase